MDWRNRKYYVVRFYSGWHNALISLFSANCSWMKIHPYNYHSHNQYLPKGYYNAVISFADKHAASGELLLLHHFMCGHLNYKEVKQN